MWTVSLAEAFIHVFQVAGKIFLDMMTGLIPMLICLLLAINFLMKLVGTVRMEKVAALLGRSRILTYGVLPVLGWFFMSSPGALTLGKLLPEKSKPGYEDALGLPVTSLALRYIAAAMLIGLIRGIITEYLFLRLSKRGNAP
ncbi:TPA: PTS glucitol/sorbitol transporter subunit IIC [Escherichia coli]